MALTPAEAAKLSNDVLLQGVIETIIKDSPVLQRRRNTVRIRRLYRPATTPVDQSTVTGP